MKFNYLIWLIIKVFHLDSNIVKIKISIIYDAIYL
jgi:hypothetical protein